MLTNKLVKNILEIILIKFEKIIEFFKVFFGSLFLCIFIHFYIFWILLARAFVKFVFLFLWLWLEFGLGLG